MARMPAKKVVEMTRDVERLAERLAARTLATTAVDIADLYAAARLYCDCIDQLLKLDKKGKKDAARLIGEGRAWIKSELLPHGRVVEKRFDAILEEL